MAHQIPGSQGPPPLGHTHQDPSQTIPIIWVPKPNYGKQQAALWGLRASSAATGFMIATLLAAAFVDKTLFGGLVTGSGALAVTGALGALTLCAAYVAKQQGVEYKTIIANSLAYALIGAYGALSPQFTSSNNFSDFFVYFPIGAAVFVSGVTAIGRDMYEDSVLMETLAGPLSYEEVPLTSNKGIEWVAEVSADSDQIAKVIVSNVTRPDGREETDIEKIFDNERKLKKELQDEKLRAEVSPALEQIRLTFFNDALPKLDLKNITKQEAVDYLELIHEQLGLLSDGGLKEVDKNALKTIIRKLVKKSGRDVHEVLFTEIFNFQNRAKSWQDLIKAHVRFKKNQL